MLIDISTREAHQSDLNQTSAAIATSLFTVSQTKIHLAIGGLSPALMAQIDDCLKAALGLPSAGRRFSNRSAY